MTQTQVETLPVSLVECDWCCSMHPRHKPCGCDESERARLRSIHGTDKARVIMEYRLKLDYIASLEGNTRMRRAQLNDGRGDLEYKLDQLIRQITYIATYRAAAELYRIVNGIEV